MEEEKTPARHQPNGRQMFISANRNTPALHFRRSVCWCPAQLSTLAGLAHRPTARRDPARREWRHAPTCHVRTSALSRLYTKNRRGQYCLTSFHRWYKSTHTCEAHIAWYHSKPYIPPMAWHMAGWSLEIILGATVQKPWNDSIPQRTYQRTMVSHGFQDIRHHRSETLRFRLHIKKPWLPWLPSGAGFRSSTVCKFWTSN